MFVDRVRINIRGGDGGAGVVSFVRRKGRPRGKPVGGSGGSGGDVTLEAAGNVATLLRYDRRPHWRAGDGTHGQGDNRDGRAGEDLVLFVPLGTVVRDEDDVVLADLVTEGERVTVSTGGRGGRGNAALVSRERRAPTFAEQGEFGRERWITLELKLLADAALIGFPNAGKSTLISRVSAAHPKVADYPFTTLEPHLGVVQLAKREFVLADIPGLIEGAAEGKGLGHEFLRHVERARALVVLLDPSPLQTESPRRQYEVLVDELSRHDPALATRPRVVVLNKADLSVDDGTVEGVAADAADAGVPFHVVSAVTGDGLTSMLHAVADAVDQAKRLAPEREGFVLHRPLGTGFDIRRIGGEWVVEGLAAERAVNLNDLTIPEAADFAAARLRRIGVDDALRAAGALPGDDVRIGGIVFTFTGEDADEEDIEAGEAADEVDAAVPGPSAEDAGEESRT